MAHTSPAQTSPSSVPKRPKGILKNPSSYRTTSHSPSAQPPPAAERAASVSHARPSLPGREFSEKELTQMNTMQNAGNGHRRNSSNPRGSVSRRQSSSGGGGVAAPGMGDEGGERIKWDEANLWQNEGQMGGKMKIDEPKTPYARQYDPSEEDDEDPGAALDPSDLVVDELDKAHTQQQPPRRKAKEDDIPGLDIGEPEIEATAMQVERTPSDGEKRVIVDDGDAMDVDGAAGGHGEGLEGMTPDEMAKHRKFEEMRKKHYEMKNVKDLLGHPEELDELDGEEGEK
ncbi:hypothetical protein LTR50_005078 [Elasticomyces elasticus]|nr:hypothetical protein LTR50_005078 [Elasticomyces elasticus]